MKSRYTGYPESWAEFVSIVKSMIRGDEGAWFLCSEDYDVQGDKAWQWNEWELLSQKAAGNYAISIKEGSIVYGNEPEFEECQTVADAFEDFMKKIISGEIRL